MPGRASAVRLPSPVTPTVDSPVTGDGQALAAAGVEPARDSPSLLPSGLHAGLTQPLPREAPSSSLLVRGAESLWMTRGPEKHTDSRGQGCGLAAQELYVAPGHHGSTALPRAAAGSGPRRAHQSACPPLREPAGAEQADQRTCSRTQAPGRGPCSVPGHRPGCRLSAGWGRVQNRGLLQVVLIPSEREGLRGLQAPTSKKNPGIQAR